MQILRDEKEESKNYYKMKQILLLIALILVLSLTSCQSTVDIEKLEKELLQLHHKTIEAHLNKDAGFFIEDISENYMQVHNGEFVYPQKEDIYNMFTHYLNSTDFLVYEDVSEPIVRVANDGSIGWTIVQVNVKGEQKQENDSILTFDNTFAWITMYENINGKWIRLGEVDNVKVSD